MPPYTDSIKMLSLTVDTIKNSMCLLIKKIACCSLRAKDIGIFGMLLLPKNEPMVLDNL